MPPKPRAKTATQKATPKETTNIKDNIKAIPKETDNTNDIQQLTMLEHVKIRSMWAGSKHSQSIDTYTIQTENKEKVFNVETLHYPPSLYKIIDEIIVNAMDHYIKNPKTVSVIDISTNPKDYSISVFNNGPGIPVKLTTNIKGEEIYMPQKAFSEFLAGSNLDDNKDVGRIVGGQNGLGAKLTAAFSSYFKVETTDTTTKKYYVQEFFDGLTRIDPPKIQSITGKTNALNDLQKHGHTRITFIPDYKEFKLDPVKFYPTLCKLIEARAYQAAAYTGLQVMLNNVKININTFTDFCEMFTNYDVIETHMTSATLPYKWDVCFSLTDGKAQQFSIINGIIVSGGNHVKHIQGQLVENLKAKVEKEIKKAKVSFNKNMILNNVFIFMKGAVPNPEFSSQTKDILATPIEKFADYVFPSSLWSNLWALLQPAIMELFLKKQLGEERTRANRGKINVPKYREANFCRDAKRFHECGLILTEGDSANGTATKGLLSSKATPEYFNFDYFGTFQLLGVIINGLKESTTLGKKKSTKKATKAKKGDKEMKTEKKIVDENEENDDDNSSIISDVDALIDVNARKIPNSKLLNNERIRSLIKVLGLDFNKKYDFTEQGDKEWKTLRYGFIVGLTDQDLDGFNIFGLIVTFFTTYWPALVERKFIRRIFTPLIRLYPVRNRKLPVRSFYSEKQMHEWLALQDADVMKHYKVQYYKGLATHDEGKKEVSNMFRNITDKICIYTMDEMAIRNMYIYYGEKTCFRKQALASPVSKEPINDIVLPLSQQFEIDTKSFQRDNIIRKLLNAVDGFVVSRRKVFYTIRKHGNDVIKVAGLASKTVELADYHHGEVSLEQTIVRMAQAYPMARRLPLLLPRGNFGSRGRGYKDYGASMYIYTCLNHKLANKLFRKEDEYVLEYEVDEGVRYEPKYYAPIIPYSVCETNELPATGWNICVYARDLPSVFKNVRAMIKGATTETNKVKCGPLPMDVRDFKGEVRKYKGRSYFVGCIEYDEARNAVVITELPPSMCSDVYLKGPDESIRKQTENKENGVLKGIQTKKYVDDYEDNTNDQGVNITIYLTVGAFEEISKEYGNDVLDCLEHYFELYEPIYDRINLVNEKGEVVEYQTYEDVCNDWFVFRKNLYAVRIDREIILNNLEVKMLKNQQRFNLEYEDYNINNKTNIERVNAILSENKYDIFNTTMLFNPKFTSLDMLVELITKAEHGASYEYLISMTIRDLATEAYNKRQKRIEELEKRHEYLVADDLKKSFKGCKMWLLELDELEAAINEGITTAWSYGENDYVYDDNDGLSVKPKSKRASKK